jgi:EmrB/QacA subfamily drug resistance transporter
VGGLRSATRPATGPVMKGSSLARDRAVLSAMCTATIISAGGATMVTVALPQIGDQLGVGYSDLQWVANVYAVVLATLMLPATTLANNVGRRRAYCTGMLIVLAGSFLAAAAPNLFVLLLGRILQGSGAAIVGPTSLNILAHQFVDPRDRARAVGLWAGGAGVGLALGPLVAGALIGALGWQSVFWLVGLIALGIDALAWWSLSESRHGRPATRAGIDVAGATAIAVTLGALSFGFIESAHFGWTSPVIVGSFVVTVVGLIAFIVIEQWQSLRGRPVLMPMVVWHYPRFVAANIGGGVFFLALYGMLFLYSVYGEQILHHSPFSTGLAFLPMTASMAVLAVLAGRIVAVVGVRVIAVTGLLIAAAGCLLLVTAGPLVSTAGLSVRFVVLGIGFGLVSAPLTVTAVSAVPASMTGIASSIYNAMRQVGAVVGVAVLGAIASIGGVGSTHRIQVAMLFTSVLLVMSAALVAVLLRQPAESNETGGAGDRSTAGRRDLRQSHELEVPGIEHQRQGSPAPDPR